MLKASEEYISSLINDVEYHRAIYQKHLDIHEKLIESIKERNFIEAKEKNLINDFKSILLGCFLFLFFNINYFFFKIIFINIEIVKN
ncbi:hypothetical protein ACYSNM_13670 [Myroides sp. LJL116]